MNTSQKQRSKVSDTNIVYMEIVSKFSKIYEPVFALDDPPVKTVVGIGDDLSLCAA